MSTRISAATCAMIAALVISVPAHARPSALTEPPPAKKQPPELIACTIQSTEYRCLDPEGFKQLLRILADYEYLHTQLGLTTRALALERRANVTLDEALVHQQNATKNALKHAELIADQRDKALERAEKAEAVSVRAYLPWIITGSVVAFGAGVWVGARATRPE